MRYKTIVVSAICAGLLGLALFVWPLEDHEWWVVLYLSMCGFGSFALGLLGLDVFKPMWKACELEWYWGFVLGFGMDSQRTQVFLFLPFIAIVLQFKTYDNGKYTAHPLFPEEGDRGGEESGRQHPPATGDMWPSS